MVSFSEQCWSQFPVLVQAKPITGYLYSWESRNTCLQKYFRKQRTHVFVPTHTDRPTNPPGTNFSAYDQNERPYETAPNLIIPNQTTPSQTKLYHTIQNQTKSNQTYLFSVAPQMNQAQPNSPTQPDQPPNQPPQPTDPNSTQFNPTDPQPRPASTGQDCELQLSQRCTSPPSSPPPPPSPPLPPREEKPLR